MRRRIGVGVLEPFARLTPGEREVILRAVLDHFRHKFALNAELLKADKLRELSKRCTQELNEHWGIDPDADDLIEARVLVLERVDERLPAPVGALLSARSKIGGFLRQKLDIRADEYDALIPQLLQRLTAHGLLVRVQGAVPMYQLNVASLVWCKGDGTPQVSSLDARSVAATRVNPFFTDLYRAQPSQLAGLEAREHTAQVVERGERERRERRFSGAPEERPLPYLVCSPTMELGIDIADLDLVHLRNVPRRPPTTPSAADAQGAKGSPGSLSPTAARGTITTNTFSRALPRWWRARCAPRASTWAARACCAPTCTPSGSTKSGCRWAKASSMSSTSSSTPTCRCRRRSASRSAT
jgi:hypothetical protein